MRVHGADIVHCGRAELPIVMLCAFRFMRARASTEGTHQQQCLGHRHGAEGGIVDRSVVDGGVHCSVSRRRGERSTGS